MFNKKKCLFESSWIVWLEDMAVALMSGTAHGHEEIKKKKKRHCRQCPSCLTCRRPFYTDFTITFLFVLFSQTKALETVEKLRSKHCSNISKHATFILHSLMLLFRWRDIKPWYNTLIRLKLKYQVTDKPNNLAGILPQPFELR